MPHRTLFAGLIVCAFAVPAAAQMAATPYAGQQARTIKSLSAEDITALRNGEGMGMAKAAELNGYPGPIHVLDIVGQLGLTADQARQITAIRDRMSATAQPLGAEIIDREGALDKLFAKGQITPDALKAETATIGELRGQLRAVHLAAHLETRALLTPEQIARYQQLRGYGDPAGPEHHHQHG
jgi:Spy/CpxP family protein refolding chaperone